MRLKSRHLKRTMNLAHQNNPNLEEEESPAKRQKHMNPNENTSNDQSIQLKCSYVSETTRILYLNEQKADVHFIFQGQRIPAHKSILSLASSLFDKMFYGQQSSTTHSELLLFGYSAETFKDFLQFFYLNQVTLKSSNITEVVRLLHDHRMPKCVEICSQFWLEHYDRNNIDDICLAYEYAMKLKEPKFLEFCERIIRVHSDDVFNTRRFLACSINVVDRILTLDSLMCDESVVLDACLKWARYKCEQNGQDANDLANLRGYLTNHSNGENLLYKIRFGSITNDEILKHLNTIDGILVDGKERTDVIRLVLKSTTLESGKFQAEPRKSLWIDEQAMDCKFPKEEFCRIVEVKQRNFNVLKTNQTILLGGLYLVQMNTLNLKSNEIPINVSIKEQRNGCIETPKLIHKERITVHDHLEEHVPLKPRPIVMKPGREYHIEFHFDDKTLSESDTISFYGASGVIQRMELNENLTIECYSKDLADHLLIRGFKFIEL